jgi:hypothetical protein
MKNIVNLPPVISFFIHGELVWSKNDISWGHVGDFYCKLMNEHRQTLNNNS